MSVTQDLQNARFVMYSYCNTTATLRMKMKLFITTTQYLTRHSPVERSKVDHTVALLKLPRLYLLTLPMGAELDFDAAGAQERRRPARRMLLGANLVSINSPRLGKLIHVKLKVAVASHRVIALVAIVVAAKATQASTQVGSSDNLHETVTIPCYLQTCRWRWRVGKIREKLIPLPNKPNARCC